MKNKLQKARDKAIKIVLKANQKQIKTLERRMFIAATMTDKLQDVADFLGCTKQNISFLRKKVK